MSDEACEIGRFNAVIVTYNPDLRQLEKTITSIQGQVSKVYVIDNKSDNFNEIIDLLKGLDSNLSLIELDDNKGVAYATNVGMEHSLKTKASHTLISDQDTCYPSGYISEFITKAERLGEELKNNIAAYCPSFLELNSDVKHMPYTLTSLGNDFHSVYQAIASGLLVDNRKWEEIGGMNSDLFIDWVDFEWCWRAISKRYLIVRYDLNVVNHQLGDSEVRFLWRRIFKHNNVRCYYIVRNAFYLFLYSPNLSKKRRITGFLSSFKYVIVFPLVSDKKQEALGFCLKGVMDGILGRLGSIKGKVS